MLKISTIHKLEGCMEKLKVKCPKDKRKGTFTEKERKSHQISEKGGYRPLGWDFRNEEDSDR